MQINVIEYFEKTVAMVPDRTAVIEGDHSITFTELKREIERLSDKIITKNKIRNQVIGVFIPKSIQCVVADLAITYSGNAYMNLDVKSPLTRIEGILNHVKPAIVITSVALYPTLQGINTDVEVIIIDSIENDIIKATPSEPGWRDLIDTDPYCVINTSGSTGIPKGVVLNHKSFIDFTEWSVETMGFSDDEIMGSLSPSIFDIFSFELCMLMAKASTLVILPESMAAFPAKLLDIMNQTRVSFIFWVPTIMVNIANMDLFSKINLETLRMIWFAGEVFPTKQFNYWKRHLSSARFVNLYGPIEITLDCTYFIVDRDLSDDEPIPIGFPCRNTDVLILNENDNLAGPSEEGELCVRGTSLAMGYYNNPERTAAAFVQNPLNKSYPEIIYRTGDIVYRNERGEIIFKGRKDSMIKHLGYRIELGEIEHVLINTLKLVKNACVVYNKIKKEITVFYESDIALSGHELRIKLSSVLPKYAIPTAYFQMDELPRNPNGKINRLLLTESVNSGTPQ